MKERFAILGDIHSNLEAFEAIVKDSKKQNVTHYQCVGDVIGYNADPIPCLERIIEMEFSSVLGNHDHYCSVNTDMNGFHPTVANVVEWTRNQLSKEHISYLQTLSMVEHFSGFTLVHSSLDMPEKWRYVFDELGAAVNFSCQSTPLCFYGHTHVPVAFEYKKSVVRSRLTQLSINTDSLYFINVGSVGQPRDGDPRAAYCIYDTERSAVELRRISYDVGKTQNKIRKAGLPERLARRLQFGQ